MKIRFYHIDSFTDKAFGGNPAGVCLLDGGWPEDGLMRDIAAENQVSETAFVMKKDNRLHIRWFTPAEEVDLCGHATLAAAFALLNREGLPGNDVSFESKSGALGVKKNGDILTMDFPADRIEKVGVTAALQGCFDAPPLEVFKGKSDFVFVYRREEDISGISPKLAQIAALPARGVIVTARGDHSDYVLRFFGPKLGVDEDPATGSAQTTLAPYWGGILGKDKLTAVQLSARRGSMACRVRPGRVEISGRARLYLKGEIEI